MGYSVKELFFTLQGEGARSGRAAVFLRFTGCNLWTGREEDRAKGQGGCARWCDTDFVGTNGENGARYADADSLAQRARALWDEAVIEPSGAVPYVVCTGGEPLLQLDAALVDALHARGFEVAVETNGTLPLPCPIDWVCVSPKHNAPLVLAGGDEIKLVFSQGTADTAPEAFERLAFRHWFLQPMDGLDRAASARACVAYCRAHPRWRLSLQTHKLVGIP
jgi:7-carboxy-7-deazaguanine synthase